jgi:hypothetical protein
LNDTTTFKTTLRGSSSAQDENLTLYLPGTMGVQGQVLTLDSVVNSVGFTDWTTPSGGGGGVTITGSNTNNNLLTANGDATINGEGGLTFDGKDLRQFNEEYPKYEMGISDTNFFRIRMGGMDMLQSTLFELYAPEDYNQAYSFAMNGAPKFSVSNNGTNVVDNLSISNRDALVLNTVTANIIFSNADRITDGYNNTILNFSPVVDATSYITIKNSTTNGPRISAEGIAGEDLMGQNIDLNISCSGTGKIKFYASVVPIQEIDYLGTIFNAPISIGNATDKIKIKCGDSTADHTMILPLIPGTTGQALMIDSVVDATDIYLKYGSTGRLPVVSINDIIGELSPNTIYLCDSSGGSFSLILPHSTVALGDYIEIIDAGGNFGNNPLNLTSDGSYIYLNKALSPIALIPLTRENSTIRCTYTAANKWDVEGDVNFNLSLQNTLKPGITNYISGSFTYNHNLPIFPAIGDIVKVVDSTGNASSGVSTIDCANTSNIIYFGDSPAYANSVSLNRSGMSITFEYVSLNRWQANIHTNDGVWAEYNVIVSADGTNPTFPSNVQINVGMYTIIGKTLHLKYDLYFTDSTGGTTGSGTYAFSLPPGCTIKNTVPNHDFVINNRTLLGNGIVYDSSDDFTAQVLRYDSTKVSINYQNTGVTSNLGGSSGVNFTTPGFGISFTATIPLD